MSPMIYLTSLSIAFGTVLAIFAMRYAALTRQAKARLANDDAYRRMAEQAVTAQSETAAALTAIQADLSEVRTRLTAVEKVLKDVE